MLLVLANLPIDTILSGDNVLALLGGIAGRGQWLKILVVVDAVVVLCGGIMTGIIAFCGPVEALSGSVFRLSVFRHLACAC